MDLAGKLEQRVEMKGPRENLLQKKHLNESGGEEHITGKHSLNSGENLKTLCGGGGVPLTATGTDGTAN